MSVLGFWCIALHLPNLALAFETSQLGLEAMNSVLERSFCCHKRLDLMTYKMPAVVVVCDFLVFDWRADGECSIFEGKMR